MRDDCVTHNLSFTSSNASVLLNWFQASVRGNSMREKEQLPTPGSREANQALQDVLHEAYL